MIKMIKVMTSTLDDDVRSLMEQLQSARPAWLDVRRPHVLIVATGSVATVKVPELAVKLSAWADVKVVLTARGAHMFERVAPSYGAEAWAALEAARAASTVVVVTDADEWEGYADVRSDSVLHIELRRWADVALYAPCSCNTLTKLAHGLSDNLATCIARAWDARKPMLVAPAANTAMWQHPTTARDLDALFARGVLIIPPVTKKLACGEVGVGAMASVETLCERLKVALAATERCAAGSDGGGEWARRGFVEWVVGGTAVAAEEMMQPPSSPPNISIPAALGLGAVALGVGVGLGLGLARACARRSDDV
tara:strand:- start:54 stop:983 length:930 start_codon:yes stop_codon:yes gene_type:complete